MFVLHAQTLKIDLHTPSPVLARQSQLSTREQKARRPSNLKNTDAKHPIDNVQSRGKRVSHNRVRVDGEVFRVGDIVYVVMDEKYINSNLENEAEDEAYKCGICGSSSERISALLECSKCVCGYHLHCLNPPLNSVPEGRWMCPNCAAGKAPRKRSLTSAREHFLQQKGLGLVRIESIYKYGNETEFYFQARWFCLPEETHIGRQHHHAAREVFLLQLQDEASVHSILRHASVISMSDYTRDGSVGDDVFVCDYEYDLVWQRFRRRARWNGGEDDDDCDVDYEAEHHARHSDDEDLDATYTMKDALAHMRGRPSTGRSTGAFHRLHRQGGDSFNVRIGSRGIPHHVREEKRNDPLRHACRSLALATQPKSLPCRENERASIEQFVEKVLESSEDGAGKCLYISGIPGTGKTATVLEVMRTLRKRAEQREIPQFHFVEVNGLRLPSPHHAYADLYESLTGERRGPKAAATALEDLFDGRAKHAASNHPSHTQHTIVMLDEMDLLINRSQTVLYNLFDWPSRPGSRLSIIGIANTMDLPERLHPRIGSRLAGCRLVFHPYQRDQLVTIMHSRMKGCEAFDANAITMVARKVANCSGDLRRCLELCRRGAEIALERHDKEGKSGDPRVTIRDVDAAIREAFSSPHIKIIRQSCKAERLFLAALHLETRYTGQCEVPLANVASRLAVLSHGKVSRFTTVVQCAVGLAARKVVICDVASKRLKAKVALNVPVEDVTYVLTNDKDLAWLSDKLK